MLVNVVLDHLRQPLCGPGSDHRYNRVVSHNWVVKDELLAIGQRDSDGGSFLRLDYGYGEGCGGRRPALAGREGKEQ